MLACCEPYARDEVSTVSNTAIAAFNVPRPTALVKSSTFHVLVELEMLLQVPFRINVLKVSSQVLPARVPFFECEVLPELLVEDLVDRKVRVYSCPGIY